MAILVKSSTHEKDKNRFATLWEAFSDVKKLTGYHFILDAAAEPETTKCENFIGPQENALVIDWGRRVRDIKKRQASWMNNGYGQSVRSEAIWCNPPFDNKFEFIQKSYDTVMSSKIPVVMMLPYERQTIWWQTMIHGIASKVFIPDRRYSYYLPDGKTILNQVNFGSAFIVIEPNNTHPTMYIDFSVMRLRTEGVLHQPRNLIEEYRQADSARRKFVLAESKQRKQRAK
ncbi:MULTISPECIES: DNA N-6-adenine-methyltransferase [Pseudoalteromonas]|uniref:DNA N-6-adenine-methyltransferase n=1 Tax=Pseudoalteromonas TaxID=53246 RepID=UPI00110A0D6A|nr:MULTISPECIES: DNA N-6-adenine-methyltransferase [Pseudoalteromonas]MCG7545380.1 phage N-6-adenine-methyltransferase [Pseudoalteromonas sp. MM17-2]TMO87659.1 hypothetical protein CWC12_10285 [Pseudoalteromonas ruthenica]TMP22264.1 hypothetical protein CWC06_15725 [Pseudoalteromonas ruthenica]